MADLSKINCPSPADITCSEFQLTKTASLDNNLIDSVMNESLNIGAADVHIFKMLGVHEQGDLIDLLKNGQPISGGDGNTYSAENAFTAYCNEWRSSQRGAAVVASAYIGYDFGEIKLENGRNRYGVPTAIRHPVSSIGIKQGSNSQNRATKVRIERSADGKTWYGADIIELPDNDQLNTISFKSTVQERYWRIRPVAFNGGPTDYWVVQALQMMDYEATSLSNVQDKIYLENRDRDYASEYITLKGYYDLIDTHSELTKYGYEMVSVIYTFRINFYSCVEKLGRPVVVGDIIELPSEKQYTSTLEEKLKYLEVTDVGWSTEGYTPGWVPNTLQVIAKPMIASQETQDIFGGLAPIVDEAGLSSLDDGNHPIFQDLSVFDQSIKEEAAQKVPEKGREAQASIREFTQEDIDAARAQGVPHPETTLPAVGLNDKSLYAEDAMPPNSEPYTEGTAFPETPANGDYHRLTYAGMAQDIPTRLYRYSGLKGRWIYLETDRRAQYNQQRPLLQEFLSSPNKSDIQNIDKKKPPIDGEGILE